jgi:hypothetical protein
MSVVNRVSCSRARRRAPRLGNRGRDGGDQGLALGAELGERGGFDGDAGLMPSEEGTVARPSHASRIETRPGRRT